MEAAVYSGLVTAAPAEGLWPVVVAHEERVPAPGRVWTADRAWDPPTADFISGISPAAVLARWWERSWRAGSRMEPFGPEFPGLVRRSTKQMDSVAQAAESGTLLALTYPGRLGFVSTARPADTPAVLGWRGARNAIEDTAALSAVLRSWEDRFGALLIGLGPDELILSVAAPPTTLDRALRVAAEHLAVCDRAFIHQPSSFREFATSLLHCHIWRFRWS
jgi:hypothetical protein